MAKEELKMYKVTINSGESESDKGDVTLVHNYKQITIQRDKEVEISENYVNILKDAVVVTAIRDENGKPVLDKDGNEKVTKSARFSTNIQAV
jgi:hypothetical protein